MSLSSSPVVRRWGLVRREILQAVKRNQPAPQEPFEVACAMNSGLSVKKIREYLDDFKRAGLIRYDDKGRLQLEESAEALLGFK